MAEDSVDLDTIVTLEGRITAALDRIAAAAAVVAIGGREADAPDPGMAEASAALDAARAETEALRERIAELEAAAGDSSALEAAEARVAELEAALHDAQSRATEMGAELDRARGDAGDGEKLVLLQQRVARLKEERNNIRDERDALAEELDNYRAGVIGGDAAGESPAETLAALRDLRAANAELSRQCEALRQEAVTGEGAPSPETLDAAMAAELLALRAERAADAAELEQVLAELRPAAGEGGAHA
ncbi:hypothetical protein HKCCE3408_18445 [Rhodobacterales bacterium HKCCE3408]|nr:hypothetical protein [Rhodobacterales bacterium HKCCE3408]